MSRLFFSFRVPSKLCARFAEEATRLDRAGARVLWAKAENLHITLRFVGEVHERNLLEVLQAGKQALQGMKRLPLVAVGLDAFPDREHPRVVVCGVRGDGEAAQTALLALRAKVDAALDEAGWKPEREVWRPHVTLGRVRGDLQVELLGERIGPAARREFGHFTCSEVVLFESFHGREGVSYTPLQTFSAC